jgi:hypothetical protein
MLEKLKAKVIIWVLKGVPYDPIRRKLFIWKGKEVVDQYLKEDKDMDGKSKWQSKSVWTAIIAVLLGAVQPISTALGHPVVVPTWVYEVLAGFGLYALRDGLNKPLQ